MTQTTEYNAASGYSELDALELLYGIADRISAWCNHQTEPRYQADVLELLPKLWLVAPDAGCWQRAREAIGGLLLGRKRAAADQAARGGEPVDVAALSKLTFAGRLVELAVKATQPTGGVGVEATPDRIRVEINGRPVATMALLQTFDREVKGMLEQRAAGIVQGRFEDRLAHIELILDECIESLGIAAGRDKQVLDEEPLAEFVARTAPAGAHRDG
jgi:hypothetical protein